MRVRICFKTAFLFLLIISLSACSGIRPIKGDKSDLNIVAKIGDVPVYLEEVKYLAENYKQDMEKKYGEGIWDNADTAEKYRAELEENILGGMKKSASFVSLAKKYGVDIDDKETEKYVNEYINSQFDDKAVYIEQLEENGITDHHWRYLIAIESSKEELRQVLCREGVLDDSDEKARSVIESDAFIRTLNVYIGNDEGEDIEANRAKAEEALRKLEEGEKLPRVIGRYSDYDGTTTTDGHYFMRGEHEKAYEEAAFALDENEYSDVVEGENGFYIIARLPKDAEYIEKNFETLKAQYLYVEFNELLSNEAEQAELEFTEYGKTLDLAATR
ncbi:MAG: peptidylprolyl isomerase [Clostridia bacterium]|nr:peptidylprolyl isomerase [Clostridia bacterium]